MEWSESGKSQKWNEPEMEWDKHELAKIGMSHKWNEDNLQWARKNGMIWIRHEPEIEWAKNGMNKIWNDFFFFSI